MNQQRYGLLHVLLLLGILLAHVPRGLAQVGTRQASKTVKRAMTAALARCHFRVGNVEAITFIPASNEEFETIKSLGSAAIEPLSTYMDAKADGGLVQFFAVKFLTALRSPTALSALQRAFAPDQWEVTRMAALYGMFETSKEAARPYIEAALDDESPLVRQTAERLYAESGPPGSDN